MATFQLTVQQVILPSDDLSIESSSVDSFGSVVDPNVDFHLMDKTKECGINIALLSDFSEEWKSSMKSTSVCSEQVPTSSISPMQTRKEDGVPLLTHNSHINSLELTVNDSEIADNYGTLGTSYPIIPMAVAQYLNKHKPELCSEAEKYFSTKNYRSTNETTTSLPVIEFGTSPTSPLRSMSSTSDALALQHSVIGNPGVVPVSAEIVAQVVADTRLRLQQPSSKGSSRSSLHSFSSLQHELNDENSTVKDDNRSEPSKTKLIRYPNEYITSTTEKKSWLAYVTPENNISSVPKLMFESPSDHKQTASMRSCTNSVGPMINLKTEMPIVHTPMHRKFYKRDNACGNSGEGSSVSSQENTIFSTNDCETESSFSEKFEIESACSEAFETESNISEISGIDDEMFQIRKLLIDVPLMSDYPFSEDCSNINGSSSSCKDLKHNGTQVCADMCNATTSPIKPLIKTSHDERSTRVDQSTETNDFQLFEVIREKANLEGQFENITKERNDLMSENIHLQSLTNSLQTQLNLYVSQSELILNEKQNILKELQFQGKEHKKWDSVIKEYQDIIDTKNSEIKALKEDLSESEQKNSQLRINFEELKVDLESKDGGISGLKKKIAELHVELQVHLQEKIQLKNEVKNVRSEMSMLQKSKEWYQDQLHITQENRNILHQKLITIQGCEVTVSNNLEKIKSENNCLKQQLAEIQHRAVNEKEVLMKHLEIIQEDLKERESLFEEIQRDKGAAEEALIERARKVDEERSKLTNFTFMVSDLEHQMNIAKFNASEKEVLVSDLEKQKAELTKQIAVLQKSTNDKDLSIQKLTQDFKDLNTKMKHMEAVLLSSETLISTLKDEKTACDVALASANAEKRIIDEALRTLKGNLNRIENNFRQMKTDFVTKSSQVEQLLKEKNHLDESLRKSEEFLLHQQKDFETISISGNKDVELKFGDLEKEKGYLENILDVYSKDLQYCHHTIAELKKENENLKNEFAKLKLNAKCTEEEVELLNSENMTLHEKISVVNKTVSLQNLVNHSSAVAQDSVNSGNLLKQTEFENILIKLKKEQREKQRIFESNIKLLTRKLKEKMKDCKNAQNELKKLKEDSSNQMQPQSDTSNNSGSFDCLQCKKLADVHKTCENLEEELKAANSTIQEQKKVVENSEEVIINLEKEIGRTKSISESNNALKLEITQLESHLGEKGRIISELTYKIRELDQKLNDDNSNNQSKIITLEEEINKDKSLIKGLRHQVFQEKRENSQIFRQLGTLKLGLERANQTADSRKQKISSLQAELSLKLESELKHKAQIQQLQTEIRIHQNEIEKLAKEMEEVKARDPALAEQMNSLSWHLKEKSNEVAALQKKHDLMECRHSSELQNLQNTIQSLQSEMEKLKNELVETRKDKFCYQAKVTELRKALKLRLNKQKAAEKQKDKKTEQDSQPVLGLDIPDPQVSFDESYIKSLLERSLQLPDNRPLNHLQECVNSLKQEMAELQKQLSSNMENSL